MPVKQWLELVPLLRAAVEPGRDGGALDGVAVLSPAGEPVGYAGALARYEVRALAALVRRDGPPDLLRRLFEGELAETTLDRDTRCATDLAETTLDQNTGGATDLAETTLDQNTGGATDLAETTLDQNSGGAGGDAALPLLDRRTVFLGIAGRCVFVVALAGPDLARSRIAASDLRDDIEQLIRDSRARLGATWVPPSPDSSGSGSPAPVFAWPPRLRDPRGNN